MRFIIQNVQEASVEIVWKNVINSIWMWLLIYVWIWVEDIDSYKEKINRFVNKIWNLKLFSLENWKIELSLKDVSWEILMISNFTLYWSQKKWTKIDYCKSAPFKNAKIIYLELIESIRVAWIKIKSWKFWWDMKIRSINNWPINFILEI